MLECSALFVHKGEGITESLLERSNIVRLDVRKNCLRLAVKCIQSKVCGEPRASRIGIVRGRCGAVSHHPA